MMDVPVYLFTGFLEAGKTRFLQETLSDPKFFEDKKDRTLVILCEEGEEELDPTGFGSPAVFVETVDEPRRLNPDKLEALRRKAGATRVLVEYNGMWLVQDLYQALPEGWFIAQEFFFADASTILLFNANMRNLVVDKLTNPDLVVFNRCGDDTDRMALHKLVRGVSRRPNIVYESLSGAAEYDTIEDPLPFDVNAPVVEIGDRDWALFYRDLTDNLAAYDGKTVRFLGQVNGAGRNFKGGFVIGRPIMTCCAADIQFAGLACEDGGDKVANGSWIRLTARLHVKRSHFYGRKGPVLEWIDAAAAPAPDDPVATFY
ncbi:MAG: hypothetical protein II776_02600 [Clostridia bacterium]|nr:hypothetical protein [Clostridia bacterium]